LNTILRDFEEESESREKVVRSLSSKISGDELLVVLEHGQTGVVADIRGVRDRFFHQVADDEHAVKCACLFQLPANQQTGALVVHINNGRGVMGLLAKGLKTRFRERYGDVTLDLLPVVSTEVLQQAVDQDMIERVTLIRYERPQDRAVADTTKWVRANEIGKLELKITAYGRGQRLINNLLRRYRENPGAFSEIIEFGGITFEQAKVEVILPNRDHRTFNIQKPDSGHPLTEDLRNLDFDPDGEPTEDTLFAELRRVAEDVTD
jgi:hypothetical protein